MGMNEVACGAASCADGSDYEGPKDTYTDAASLGAGGSEARRTAVDTAAPDMFEEVLALFDPQVDTFDAQAPGALEASRNMGDLGMGTLSELLPLGEPFPDLVTAPSTAPTSIPIEDTSTGSSSDSNAASPLASVGGESINSSVESIAVRTGFQVTSMDDPKEKRRLQVVNSARRHRRRKKNERVNLENEVKLLEQQLTALRAKLALPHTSDAEAEWKELAFVHRHQRYQAEVLNEQLRRALFQQSRFVDNVKALATLSTPCKVDLNMRNFLHTYTHLGRNTASRVRDLEAISSSAKLDLAMEVVLSETESMPVSTSPNVALQPLDLGREGFGMTTLAVYAFDTSSASKTFQATCDAILREAAVWVGFLLVRSSELAVETPRTAHNVRYAASQQLFESNTTGDRMLVEVRGLSYGRIADNCGVFVYDYVDADDLHPLEDGAMKRNTVGGAVVRPETCSDGVERVVCRFICSDMHLLRTPKRPNLDVTKFSLANDRTVFESIKTSLAE